MINVATKVNLEVRLGHDGGLRFKYLWLIPGIGSTDVAKNNWEGLAIGSALAGTALTIGENVAGMDPEAVFKGDRVVDTVDLKRRVKLYQNAQRDGYGAIVVQANVEDTRLHVQEYAIEKLGVECVELKWGQGAKDIGGEVKIKNLKKAQLLRERGYIVLPDPLDPAIVKAFEAGAFTEFERHSRVGMVTEESFAARVAEPRAPGAKYLFPRRDLRDRQPPAAGTGRRRVQQGPGRRPRPLHVLRASGPGPPPAHGWQPQVLLGAHDPQRPGGPYPRNCRSQRHHLRHGCRQGRDRRYPGHSRQSRVQRHSGRGKAFEREAQGTAGGRRSPKTSINQVPWRLPLVIEREPRHALETP